MDIFNRLFGKGCVRAIVGMALAFASLHAGDSSSGVVRIEPSKIKVLLLPVLDESTPQSSPLRVQITRLRQQYQLISRNFIVLGEAMAVQAAQRNSPLKIERGSDRSAGVLDELASRTDADWVVSLTVLKVDYEDDPAFDGKSFKGFTTLKLQIRDSRHRIWLENRSHTSHATGGGPPPEILLNSLWNAADESLATALSSYPETVQVSQDGAIVDYLKGQTQPLVTVPGQPFSGLVSR